MAGISAFRNLDKGLYIQSDITESCNEKIEPVNDPNSTEVVFIISSSGEFYYELSGTDIEVHFRVRRKENHRLFSLTDADKVSIFNYVGGTLWKQLRVELNDDPISSTHMNYAHRAYMEVLLDYGDDAANTWLKTGGLIKDTAGKHDVYDPTAADGNEGLKERAKFLKGSRIMKVRSQIHADIFKSERPLLNNMKLKMTMTRNTHKYVLISDEDDKKYEIEITKMCLNIRRVKPSPELLLENASLKLIIYPIVRVKKTTEIINANITSRSITILTDEYLPSKLFFAFYKNSSDTSKQKDNPLKYHHFNLSRATLKAGPEIYGDLQMNFGTDPPDYVDAYESISNPRGASYRWLNNGGQIKEHEYSGGYSIFGFNLSTSLLGEDYKDKSRRDNLTLDLEWHIATPETLTIIFYMERDDEIIFSDNKVISSIE